MGRDSEAIGCGAQLSVVSTWRTDVCEESGATLSQSSPVVTGHQVHTLLSVSVYRHTL